MDKLLLNMTVKQFIEKALEGGWLIPVDDLTYNASKVVRDRVVDIDEYTFAGVHMVKLWHTKSAGGGGDFTSIPLAVLVLDPEVWKAVGKVEGWNMVNGSGYKTPQYSDCVPYEWRWYWHRMIDALADGKTIEHYIENIYD